MKIEDGVLKYYKGKTDTKEQGDVTLETAEFVRPYDDTAECKVFEIRGTEDRTFVFEATDPAEMKVWIESIELVRSEKLQAKQEEEKAKQIADTPQIILRFDSEGEESLLMTYRAVLEEEYPIVEEATIKQHLQYAANICEILQDVVVDIKKPRPARYNVLAPMMVLINNFLTERLNDILDGDSTLLRNANLGDMHAVLIWLTRYQVQLRDIYCPIPAGSSLQPKQCGLLEKVTCPQ